MPTLSPSLKPALRIAAWLVAALVALLVLAVGTALVLYPAPYVWRTFVWMDADVDDRLRFPAREVVARSGASELPAAPAPERVRAAFAAARPGENMDAWLAARETLGFVVLQHGRVVHEGYFNGHAREERATSFSVAKSFLSTLVAAAARDFAPHVIAFYLRELAAEFHSYYNATRMLVEDERILRARLALATAVRQVLRNGLALLGVSAPERM